MAFAFHNEIGHDILCYLCFHTVGHNAEGERKHIGRCRIVAIEHAVGIEHMTRAGRRAPLDGEETTVEGSGHGLPHLLILPHILFMTGNGRKTFHQP